MRLWFLCISICLSACGSGNPGSNTKKTEQIAAGFCQCTQTLMNLNKQAETQGKEVDFQQLQEEFARAKTCVQNIFTRFGQPLETDIPAIEAAIGINCPDWAQKKSFLSEFF